MIAMRTLNLSLSLNPFPFAPHGARSSALTRYRRVVSSRFIHGGGPFLVRSPSHSPCSCVDSDYAEIIVVRHGETVWNAEGRIQGNLDVELNDAGRQQAAALGDRLSKDPKISLVYSSNLSRAYETAQIIASRCGGLKVVTDPDLRERHKGVLQGFVYHEIPKLYPEAHQAFLSGDTTNDFPGAEESLDQHHQRCTSSLQRIGDKHKGERVVAVTHGGVIETLLRKGYPNGDFIGKVANTSIHIFHLYDDEKWTVKSLGDVSHLNQTDFL